MNPARGNVLRYTADRYTIVYVLSVFSLQLFLWQKATPIALTLAVPILFLLSIITAPINHNHQHVNVFRRPLLNRLFEIPLALQTAIGPYSWVLHHNLGHHLNYLSQHPGDQVDESRWTRRDGSQMGRLEYAVRLFLSHPIDIYRVGRKHPRQHAKYLWMRVPLYGVLAGLLWLHPVNGLVVFVVTPLLTLFHTCWVTYEHHSGLLTDDPYAASRNRLSRIYNVLSQNLGYHTAHHLRPGLHWSLLPAYHAEIEGKIPEDQKNPAFW